ncbi:Trafficking protein particle complex subunit 2-like protein [Halotydeus destructor]|nr:Trafficking protein particle complex subunit 2-like protein [Halotydeus destructor]
MSIVALAIVNRENFPLLIKTYVDYKGDSADDKEKKEALKLTYLLHSSLDIIEEKQNNLQNREPYLGLLTQLENYKIFGLLSTTKTKVIAVLSTINHVMLRDTEARNMLKHVHSSYVDATTSNPFYSPGDEIRSKSLNNTIGQIFEGAKS